MYCWNCAKIALRFSISAPPADRLRLSMFRSSWSADTVSPVLIQFSRPFPRLDAKTVRQKCHPSGEAEGSRWSAIGHLDVDLDADLAGAPRVGRGIVGGRGIDDGERLAP